MRNYWRMMEQVTLSDQKKEEIMEMLENKDARKHRMPKAGKIALAAVLAVGCVLSIAAGLPAQVYNFVSGGTMTVLPGTDQAFFDFTGEGPGPVTLEDGRVWLEAGGEKIDITGKTDENTPYILEHTDAATGNKGYLVVGGPAGDLGWVELVQIGDTCAISGANFVLPGSIDLSDAQEELKQLNPDGSYTVGGEFEIVDSPVYRPWLDKAIQQLGLEMDMAVEG